MKPIIFTDFGVITESSSNAPSWYGFEEVMPCRPGAFSPWLLVRQQCANTLKTSVDECAPATTAAAVAGTTALAHYLDGRYHLLKDLKALHKQRLGVKLFQKVGITTLSLEHPRSTT